MLQQLIGCLNLRWLNFTTYVQHSSFCPSVAMYNTDTLLLFKLCLSAFSKPPRNSEAIESVTRPPSKNVYPSPWRHHIELRENYLQVTQHVRDMYIDTTPGSLISLSSYLVQQGHVSHHVLVRSCDCFLHAVNSHVLTRCAGGRLHRIEIIFKPYFL